QPEVLRLGDRRVEVEELVEAALNVGRAEPEQRDEVNRRRRNEPRRRAGQAFGQGQLRHCISPESGQTGIVRTRARDVYPPAGGDSTRTPTGGVSRGALERKLRERCSNF